MGSQRDIDNPWHGGMGVTVDLDSGHIWHLGRCLTHADAIDTALALTRAVQTSIDRNQRTRPSYNDSGAILRRQESKLGQAILALGRVFGGPGFIS